MREVSAPEAGPVVAAFDFDGTLTRRDTFTVFLARGLGWPRFLWALLRCSPWLAGYALRLVPNHVAKGKLMQATLAGRSLAEMQDWTARWLARDFPGQLREDAMARLAWHRSAGHCCVMVSASPDIYLPVVAQQLGFDALICTEMEVQDGHLTGRMRTPNCHGEQKVLRLQAWARERFGPTSLDGVTLYAYGDTSGDKPMLRLAQLAWYRGKPWADAASVKG
ncbi:MAG: HAD-IB family hydrolase [Polaromonas sp.]|uniref:HAD-IB family hydrolase n=1 Tax=Polaromonas sp. TaxID=1869339 RepID=UPI0032674EFC